MLDWIPFDAPFFIVAVVFLATSVPAFLTLRSESGWPTRWGWVYLALISISCLVAYQKEADSALEAQQELSRFTDLLATIDRQQRIIDNGDITMLVRLECIEGAIECEGAASDNLSISSRDGVILFDGTLNRVDSYRPLHRGIPTRLITYIGQPFYFSPQERLVSVDELVGLNLSVQIEGLAEGFTVATATLTVKGFRFRGSISSPPAPGRMRAVAEFELDCLFCDGFEDDD